MMPNPPDLPARRGAKSLLLTVLGEFVYPTGGSVWTSTAVRCLDTVGITERNARQALARLGDQGIVESERHGRRTRWHLSEHGTRLLANGTERIYTFARSSDGWDGSWLLVMCSIPESQRAIRNQFRTQLTFEGFGFLSPTIAISPHPDREKAANDIVTDLGLADTAMTFRATSGTMTSDTAVLASAWELDSLEAVYRVFVDSFDGRLASAEPERVFGDVVLLVDSWRRFPFIDPELPSALLPDTWIGAHARDVFDRRRAAGHATALAWYESLEADS